MSWPAMLSAFSGHSLDDQSAAALMDRVDTKFLVPVDRLVQCLGGLSEHYSVLEMGGLRQMAYDTLYFDTPDRQLYRDHHNGKLNRMKVRIRHYRDSDAAFLEVKRKNNKGRTIKERRLLNTFPNSGQQQAGQLQPILRDVLGLSATRMSPALFVHYRRTTLMNRTSCERVTVDTDLAFLSALNGKRRTLPGLAVLELKSPLLLPDSPLGMRLKLLGYRPLAFSKYCVGTALLAPEQVKTNRFKPVLGKLSRTVSQFKEPSWNRPSIPIFSFA
ncbi:polyphosphate polymerase domain-containing protein [Marinobacter sp. CHS3-4]|uniref:polyphosphate polymerase domain-containing protein n=1 Tax=Marinobacter sp. CHS3-4 TaxID=3045174 RepID=UPI0024B484DA|nr:polyphosphate polymerase domain-containing protein [Marinobacter sp. CHS3-4]MDI9244337.1 polyphosphate polymerase domain-containing protein [Marinobacter sp. CHS3-4]